MSEPTVLTDAEFDAIETIMARDYLLVHKVELLKAEYMEYGKDWYV